jgi:hypothetical protein
MDRELYETTYIQLYEDGVSPLLSCLAAYIVATDHLRDGRTVEQQAIVCAAWSQYRGIY